MTLAFVVPALEGTRVPGGHLTCQLFCARHGICNATTACRVPALRHVHAIQSQCSSRHSLALSRTPHHTIAGLVCARDIHRLDQSSEVQLEQCKIEELMQGNAVKDNNND